MVIRVSDKKKNYSKVTKLLVKPIEILFSEIVEMRNRIIHGFRITSKQGEQILATKTRKKDGNIQFEITKEYLLDFIKKNEELSDMLYKYRGY